MKKVKVRVYKVKGVVEVEVEDGEFARQNAIEKVLKEPNVFKKDKGVGYIAEVLVEDVIVEEEDEDGI